jgi:hypothetical protein
VRIHSPSSSHVKTQNLSDLVAMVRWLRFFAEDAVLGWRSGAELRVLVGSSGTIPVVVSRCRVSSVPCLISLLPCGVGVVGGAASSSLGERG